MRLAILTITGVVVLSILAPLISRADPMRTAPELSAEGPSSDAWLGRDILGRDVFSRVLYGGRRTLATAGLSTMIAGAAGIVLGIAFGLSDRRFDRAVDACINSLLAIPAIVLALAWVALIGQGWRQVAIATGVSQIALYTQIVRSAVRLAYAEPFIEGAIAIGAGRWRLARRHILPALSPTALAYLGVLFSYSLVNSAALTFLGVSGDLGAPEWGSMLREGRDAFRVAPWIAVAPGLMLTACVFSVNRVSNALAAR